MELSKHYVDSLFAELRAKKPTSFYERFCKLAEALRVKPPKAVELKLKRAIVFTGLAVSPTGVCSASLLAALLLATPTLLLLFLDLLNPVTFLFFLSLPLGVAWYCYTYPSFKAEVLRVQAGDEAIKIILYMVTYLKLNPVFEGAVNFATAKVRGPISEDMRRAVWGMRVGKYRTLEQALSRYMPKWAVWNEDFVRSLKLLYGVMREVEEQKREELLRRALSFILESTHLRMRRYVEEITPSLTMIHMLGLMLPAFGIIMFPMVAIFLHQEISIFQLVLGYLVVLPLLNLFLIHRVLLRRPGAFMVPDISQHPELPKKGTFALRFGKTRLFVPSFWLALLLGIIIASYGLLHFAELGVALQLLPLEAKRERLMQEAELSLLNLSYPLSVVAGVALATTLYFHLNSFQRIRVRNEIKSIEEEFRIGLFSLGNTLAEGYPIEAAVSKSLEEYQMLGMQRRAVYGFFSKLLANIRNYGMTFTKALFDKRFGVLKYYPSVLVREILRVLAEASQKSPKLLGMVARTIASYLESVYAIEARIRELLAEVRGTIRLQASFIVPLICAVIGSLGMFILHMLRVFAQKLAELESLLGVAFGGAGFSSLMDVLVKGFENVVPMTVLQAVIGTYTVEAVILFSILLNGIEAGFDRVARDHLIAQTLSRAMLLFFLTSLLGAFVFQTVGLMVR